VAADKKELIRGAAIRVIARCGFHDATTDLISSEAGVSVGTLYNYFSSKKHILQYIFSVEHARRAEYFSQVVAQQTLRPLEKIEAILRFHFESLAQNPETARLMYRERYLRHQFATTDETSSPLSRYLIEVLATAKQQGELRQHDPELIGIMLAGGVEEMMNHYGQEPLANEHRLRNAAAEIVALLDVGIRAESRSKQQ